MRFFNVCFALFLLLPSIVYGQGVMEPGSPLKFCVYPSKSPKATVSMYRPLVQYLSEKIGREVLLVSSPDKETFIDRVMAGNYDLVVACVACYFELHDKAGYQAILRGEPSFHGALIVKKGRGFFDPLQLQGKKIAAIAQHSYAGYLFFQAYLRKQWITGEQQPQFNFLGTLDSVLYAVLNEQADAGLIRADILTLPKFERLAGQVEILLESRDIPHFPLIVAPGFDPVLRQQITAALTALNNSHPAAKKLFQSLNITSLAAVTDGDYDNFRREYVKVKCTNDGTEK